MKNFLKRLAAMLAVIAVLISVTALLVAPQLVIDLAGRVQAAPSGTRAILVVVAVLVDLLLIAVLVRIVRPPRKEGLVVRARGAKAEVSVDSVQRQINTRIAQVSDVLDVQTGVEVTQEGAARVEMNVRTRPDIVIPEKQKGGACCASSSRSRWACGWPATRSSISPWRRTSSTQPTG